MILGTPFGTSVRVSPAEQRGLRLVVAGGGKRLTADVWVALARPLVVMDNFAAEGGFRISAVWAAAGDIRDVRIHSTLGGECRLANLWPGRAVEVAPADGRRAKTLAANQACLAFPPSQGETYRLRPLP